VNFGVPGIQVNVFAADSTKSPVATPAEFRSDLLSLLVEIDARARRWGLPAYFPQDADVLSMARQVRLLGSVRRAESGQDSSDRDSAYRLPAERGNRAEEQLEWGKAAARYKRLVVLADPGMGKSWLLRLHAHQLVTEARELLEQGPGVGDEAIIPILMRADVLAAAPGKTLADSVTEYLVDEGLLAARSAGRMRQLVNRGAVVLLVDALDEVPRRAERHGTQAPLRRLEDLLRSWAEECTEPARLILSSRLAGYIGPPVPGAREVELLPFSAADAEEAMMAWALPARVTAVLRERMQDPALAAMSRVPLLLSLICSLATGANSRSPDLPETRTELYSAVVWQFLSGAHRSAEHGATAAALDQAQRQSLLRSLTRVAVTFADTPAGWVDRMSHADLLRAIGDGIPEPESSPSAVLGRLSTRTGVLVPTGNPAEAEQDYMFLHRSIAEYLVARHLCEMPRDERMKIVGDHMWFDPDWAEVLPLLGGLLAATRPAEAQELALHFLNQRPDPLHYSFFTWLRVIGEMPGSREILSKELAVIVSQTIYKLLRSASTRDLLVRALSRTPVWPRPVSDMLIHLVRDTNPEVRRAAVTALTGQREREATSALIARLADPDWSVAYGAASALGDRDEPEVTAALLACLANQAAKARGAVAHALAHRATPEVTRALLKCLADEDTDIRWETVHALQHHMAPEVTTALVRYAADQDDSTRLSVVRGLAHREAPEATAALVFMLGDDSEWIRTLAQGALAAQGAPEAVSALFAWVIDPDPSVRSSAVQLLAARRGSEATTALFNRLRDPDPQVRLNAGRALARREGPSVTQALLNRITDPDRAVRSAVIPALAGRSGVVVTEALVARLSDQDSGVRQAAAAALTGRDSPTVTEALLRCLTDPETWVRMAAARALAETEGSYVTKALIGCLEDKSWMVRRSAASALAGRDGPDVIRALLGCITDQAWEVADSALGALAMTSHDTSEVTNALLASLRKPELASNRYMLAQSLSGRDGPGVTQALLALLTQGDVDVRVAAIWALSGRDEPKVTKTLLGYLTGHDRELQFAAVRALAGIEDPKVTKGLVACLADGAIGRQAVHALAVRNDATVLWSLCKAPPVRMRRRDRHNYPEERFQLVISLVDRVYTKVPPRDRPRIRRQLDRITLPR
jgi:HEAT repeat protein